MDKNQLQKSQILIPNVSEICFVSLLKKTSKSILRRKFLRCIKEEVHLKEIDYTIVIKSFISREAVKVLIHLN